MEEPKILLTSAGDSLAVVTTSAEEFLDSFETEDLKQAYLFDNYCALLYCYQKDKARMIMGEKITYFDQLEESLNYWRNILSKTNGKISLYEADAKVELMWDEYEKDIEKNKSPIIELDKPKIM